MSGRVAVVVLALALWPATCWIEVARAQDFAAPQPSAPSASALAFLERGLAPGDTVVALDLSGIRWFGLESFATSAVALSAGWRTLRAAAGVSRTGDPELGWTTAGLALGAGGDGAGVALRAAVRRDLDPLPDASGPARGLGFEAGGGAWVRVAAPLVLWISSPQLWKHALAPPLARPLEIGAALDSEAGALWVARRAPPGGVGGSERVLGARLATFPVSLWLEARDGPLRGRVGCDARAGRLAAALAIEGHPVLGETVALALTIVLRGDPP